MNGTIQPLREHVQSFDLEREVAQSLPALTQEERAWILSGALSGDPLATMIADNVDLLQESGGVDRLRTVIDAAVEKMRRRALSQYDAGAPTAADEVAWYEQTACALLERDDYLPAVGIAEALIRIARRLRLETKRALGSILRGLMSSRDALLILDEACDLSSIAIRLEALVSCNQTLREYAGSVLESVYFDTRRTSLSTTSTSDARLPEKCPWSLSELIDPSRIRSCVETAMSMRSLADVSDGDNG